jgi:hypothetical protein
MNTNRKNRQTTPTFCAPRILLAIATLSFGACSAMVQHPRPTASWKQRNGQVKFSSAKTNVVGDIAIRHDADNFLAEITKAPGVRLLTISAKFGSGSSKTMKDRHAVLVKISGPLAGGGWVWKPGSLAKHKGSDYPELKDPSRVWAALPEVFQWGEAQAKGEEFRVCFPNVIMHSKSGDGEVLRFDYRRVENPSAVASLGDLTPKDRKKLPVLETVTCHLDK